VLTHNRRHFERLHRQGADHSGILSAKQDPNNPTALAGRIHATLAGLSPGLLRGPSRSGGERPA
jgi:hypothetical protein